MLNRSEDISVGDVESRLLPPEIWVKIFTFLSPIDLSKLAGINKEFNRYVVDVLKSKYRQHFPHYYKFSDFNEQTNWIGLFRDTYDDDYIYLSPYYKQLFTFVKEGDAVAIANSQCNYEDLWVEDFNQITLIDWANRNNEQKV